MSFTPVVRFTRTTPRGKQCLSFLAPEPRGVTIKSHSSDSFGGCHPASSIKFWLYLPGCHKELTNKALLLRSIVMLCYFLCLINLGENEKHLPLAVTTTETPLNEAFDPWTLWRSCSEGQQIRLRSCRGSSQSWAAKASAALWTNKG